MEECVDVKNIYTDIADDSDLDIENEIKKLAEIKQERQELIRIIKRKEKKAKVLFANLNVNQSLATSLLNRSQLKNDGFSEQLEQTSPSKIDTVKLFRDKLKTQLALGSGGSNQGNQAFNMIMNL